MLFNVTVHATGKFSPHTLDGEKLWQNVAGYIESNMQAKLKGKATEEWIKHLQDEGVIQSG